MLGMMNVTMMNVTMMMMSFMGTGEQTHTCVHGKYNKQQAYPNVIPLVLYSEAMLLHHQQAMHLC